MYGWQKSFPKEIISLYSKNKRFRTTIDVGACYGFMSYPFALHSDRVIAYEPDKHVIPYLKRNMISFSNFTLHPVALDNDNRFDDNYPDINDVDLIKIDVDGAELPILKGMENTIVRNKPVLVVEIMIGRLPHVAENRRACFDYLRKLDYNVVDVRMQDMVLIHKDSNYYENN